MKRLFALFSILSLILVLSACGDTTGKADDPAIVDDDTTDTDVTGETETTDDTAIDNTDGSTETALVIEEEDPFDNTEWLNVLAVLQQYLTAEQADPTMENKIQAGKALLLAAKFIQENMEIEEYGFTEEDVEKYVNYANMKFNAVITGKKSTADEIAEAQAALDEGLD